MRPAGCFHCHSVLSTSFSPLPGVPGRDSFTPDGQKAIQFRELWRVVKIDAVYFLAAGGYALPSPTPSLGREGISQGRRRNVT